MFICFLPLLLSLFHQKIEELEKENFKLSEQTRQLEKQVKSLGGTVSNHAYMNNYHE